MPLTITEALSEVNLIKKKIEQKQTHLNTLLVSVKGQPDPYVEVGGTIAFVKNELQAIKDLRQRLVDIRKAIATANLNTTVTIGTKSASIFDWLTWKREGYEDEMSFLKNLLQAVQTKKAQNESRPSVFKDDQGVNQLVTWQYNVDIAEVQKRIEELTEIYQKLDGQLSLKNATVTLTI